MIYNEEAQIRQCLETIKWADEIVICDSFSTDRTIEICREYTDKIYQRKFDNFRNQKKWIMDKPSQEWVLFVEADERFPEELAREIRERVSANEGYDGYWMPFKNFAYGKQMKGRFWDFKKIKLFKNGKGGWEDRLVHTGFILSGKAGELLYPVLHYPYPSLAVHISKVNRYTTLEAEQLIYSNTPVNWVKTIKAICWIPLFFYKSYFLWGDYKNGIPGFAVSLVTSFYNISVNIKYWKIRLCRKKF